MIPANRGTFHAAPVAVIGNINLDIKTSPIPASPDLFSDGETSVREIYESIGGGGANTAVAAARMGGCVHFWGCTGSDGLGSRLEAALRTCGVVPHLQRKPVATGRSINLNWDRGTRHFVSSLPNNRVMTFEDSDVDALVEAGCEQLLRADIWFSEAMLEEGNFRLLERARSAGMETYIDINWDPEWGVAAPARVETRKENVRRILPLIDCVHGNERELRFFTGCEDIRSACGFLLDRGCSEIVVHQGQKGAASFTSRRGWIEVPATPVEKIVCSTGAGDVFCAAHMLLRGLETRERLSLSAQLAADHLSGRQTFLPRLDDPGFTAVIK